MREGTLGDMAHATPAMDVNHLAAFDMMINRV